MSRLKILVFLSLTTLSGIPQLLGQSERTLQVLRFAENRTTRFPMMPTASVPGAEMKGSVKFEEGQARIELEYKGMKWQSCLAATSPAMYSGRSTGTAPARILVSSGLSPIRIARSSSSRRVCEVLP